VLCSTSQNVNAFLLVGAEHDVDISRVVSTLHQDAWLFGEEPLLAGVLDDRRSAAKSVAAVLSVFALRKIKETIFF